MTETSPQAQPGTTDAAGAGTAAPAENWAGSGYPRPGTSTPTAEQAAAWEAWYGADSSGRTLEQDFNESRSDAMRRAFLGGANARPAIAAQQPKPAPELGDWPAVLADVTQQRDNLREQLARVLGLFKRGSDGYRARLSATILRREYKDGGLDVPSGLEPTDNQ